MDGRGPSAIDPEVLRQAGFDPAASAGLFVGVSRFQKDRFVAVPFAVDDAVDLAHLFTAELGLLPPERCVLGLAGEPVKPETAERLARLLEAGARRIEPHYIALYDHLGDQAREAGPEGLLVVAVASHGFSDQGGDFLLASDSLPERVVRTGLAVAELFDTVARSPSPRRLVLLDACRERLTQGTRAIAGSPMAASFAEAIARASGQVVLAGATLGGFAYDDRGRGNGAFTAAVLAGLRGAAPPDPRGFITAGTLADFVQDEVAAWVRRNRPEDAAVSQGISRRVEGEAQSLPLAVNPEQARAEAGYRARREAAVARLWQNRGAVLSGALCDWIEKRLPENWPGSGGFASGAATGTTDELLAEIEALDGGARSQRSLRDFVTELVAKETGGVVARAGPAESAVAADRGGDARGETSGLAASAVPVASDRGGDTHAQSASRPRSGEAPLPESPTSAQPASSARSSDRAARALFAVAGVGVLVLLLAGLIALLPKYGGSGLPDEQAAAGEGSQPAPAQGGEGGRAGATEPAPGTVLEGALGMRLRFIPAGRYPIGSPVTEPGRFDNETRHPVRLTRGFWLGETEVTQGQWGRLVPRNPSYFKACGEHCPVEQVSWYEAVVFANLVSREAGLPLCYQTTGCAGTPGTGDFRCESVDLVGLDCPGYRLPTEAEWEVAARAGSETAVYTGPLTLRGATHGPELDAIAWYGGNSGVDYTGGFDCSDWPEKQFPSQRCGTHPVAGKLANEWGLHDMLGNVFEWTGDLWGTYPTVEAVDPLGAVEGTHRVFRGGSWLIIARFVRAAFRFRNGPSYRWLYLGFRLARGQVRQEAGRSPGQERSEAAARP